MKNKSILKFEDYYVDEFIFEKNKDFKISSEEKTELNLNFDFETERHNSEKFIRKINCKIFNKNYKENNKPFYLNIKISGIFHFPNYDENNQRDNEIIQKNTLAILFPYVRSIISHMTMEMQIEPVRLPPMNIKSFFEENNN